MFSLYQVDFNRSTLIDTGDYNDLTFALLRDWHEEDSARLFIIYNKEEIVSTLIRLLTNADICIITDLYDGQQTVYESTYELDSNGKYLSTKIRKLSD